MSNAWRSSGAASSEMPTHSGFRLTPAAAEYMLDGGFGHPRLHQLLTAAKGPAGEHELSGEAAALLAFRDACQPAGHGHSLPRDARRVRQDISRRTSMARVLASKLLATKALLAFVLAAGATGGVAVAATSLPGQAPSATPPSLDGVPTAYPAPVNGPDGAIDPTVDPIFLDQPSSFNTGLGPSLGTPEPATWAMMVLGFGALGAALRRRRRADAALPA